MRKISTNRLNELVIMSEGNLILEDSVEHGYGGEIKEVTLLKEVKTGDVIDWFYPNKFNH